MTRIKTTPPRGVLKTTAAGPACCRQARYHPSPDLELYVEHYWLVEWDLRGLAPERVETLPHPSVHLISTLADSVVDIRDVFGVDGDEVERAVLSDREDSSRLATVEDFLRRRGPQPDAHAARIAEIVYAVAEDRGILKVEDLVERYGIAMRTLQRLFARYVGISPKWVIQRYRLHEAAEQLAAGGSVSQSALAHELGYNDQAHFVRDFKAIVGTSPAAYAGAARPKGPAMGRRTLDPAT
jgi:AraC-like DNA-binding protein